MKKIRIAEAIVIIVAIWLMVGCRMFPEESEQIRFVKEMGAGINIGNSLDSYGLGSYQEDASLLEYETYWGNPPITADLFRMIKEAGFSTVRIPVTWQEHMDAEGQVSKEWMERVQTVVDMALAEDLYVILNTHHEEWMDLSFEEENMTLKFTYLWTRIALCFQDYDEKLLFEGMNEPRMRDSTYEWKDGTKEMRDRINRLNAAFVNTVRSTGGRNEERYLLICPYAARYTPKSLQDLEVLKGNIIVSIHMYYPYEFAEGEEGFSQWNPDVNGKKYRREIERYFKSFNRRFLGKGIPVILTEFGCVDKNNLNSRIEWVKTYKTNADKYGIPYIWWDNGKEYMIMDRKSYSWKYPEITAALLEQYNTEQ